jgi:hypothetical protein
MNIHMALKNLRPTCGFIIHGNTYEDVEWFESNPEALPTQEEVETEITRLTEESQKNQYQRDRQMAYPTIADQLDMIYHNGLDAWHAAITEVKDRFPKP